MAIHKNQMRSTGQASNPWRHICTIPICDSVEKVCILKSCNQKGRLLNPLEEENKANSYTEKNNREMMEAEELEVLLWNKIMLVDT